MVPLRPGSRRFREGAGPALVLALIWASLIAASSSTVVLRREWFAWIQAHVLTDEASLRRFILFWATCWFAIVKGWHATEFALLFGLTRAALDRWSGSRSGRNVVGAVVIALLFAISDEYHQTFVPGRGGNVSDVVIDGLGIGVAAALAEWRRRAPSGKKHPPCG